MLKHYLLIALRSFRRSPFAASVNVLALALGLAAFIAAYGVVSYWDRSERHFENADRTYVVTAALGARDGSVRAGGPSTNPLYAEYLRADFPEFEAVARAQIMNEEAGISAGDVHTRMFIVAVDGQFLDIFDLPFVAGDAKEALRRPNSAVLTQDAAQRLFGTASPLGKTVSLGNVLDATVTGVIGEIPEPSHLGHAVSSTLRFDVLTSWDTLDGLGVAVRARAAQRNAAQSASQPPGATPPTQTASASQPATGAQPSSAGQPAGGSSTPPGAQQTGAPPAAQTGNPPPPENWLGNYCCTTYVLVARDSDLTAATLSAKLDGFAERHMPVSQRDLASIHVGAVPVSGLMASALSSQLLPGAPVSITTLLLGLGGLVLVIACVNYANLATAQAARRAREVGLRKALGAGKYRVMAQYLSEAALLTIAATVIAIAAVVLVAPALHDSMGIDLRYAFTGSWRFWGFLVGLLVAVTLLGGAYPSFVLSRVPPVEALRIGRSRVGPRFAGTLLVGVQFAAASFLLIVVVVMYAQNRALERTGLGVARDPLVLIQNYPQYSGVDAALLDGELRRIPQIKAIAQTGDMPWNLGLNLLLLARSPNESEFAVPAYNNVAGYDYFSLLDIRVLAGRVFDREHGEDALTGNLFDPSRELKAVIDDAAARELGYRDPREAVDQVIYLPERMTRAFGQGAQPIRVIGVVESKPLHFRGAGSAANLYFTRPNLNMTIVRLARDDVSGGLAAIDSLWKRLSPQTSVNRKFMDDIFNQNYKNFARISQAFASLALLAVFISIIGLTGMAIHVASRRVHEIGVRKSVGARTSQIVAMLLFHFSRPVIVANLVAWYFAYLAAKQYLGIFSQRVALTPLPFVLSLGLALAIAWAAVGGQALRAARVSPARVLRTE